MADDREFDVVVWGATGFTGRLVAEYVAERYGRERLDWAIAGRSRPRLEDLRADLARVDADCEDLPVLTGDAHDRASLDDLVERTAVVCTTVGPYADHGTDLVAACAAAGTDYCDLSGEVHWMRRTVDDHHDRARETGARIVHSCGFDSVPSDLGTLLLQERAREVHGRPCSTVRTLVTGESADPTEAFSGGTLASLAGVYEAASRDPSVRRVLADPYALAPPGEREGPDRGARRLPSYDRDARTWTAPFVMAQINEKVVRRSNALLGYPYGREFRYGEGVPTGDGPLGALGAAGLAGGLAVVDLVMSVGPLRTVAERYVLPDPGEGPSEETIEESSFRLSLRGVGYDEHDGRFTVTATVEGDRDPGYGSTARMLTESAVCLAREEVDSPVEGGVLTPASGIGRPLADRLGEVGVRFEVDGDP
jgi:short subunit dehydrogenase-like uncharacterized protein